MRISVIIPTLSRPEHLASLLTDILESSRLPNEVIIVEQGERARTEEIAREFSAQGLDTHVFFQEEKSLSVARNTGVRESSGDLLIFFDDDMSVGSEYIERASEYAERHPEVLGVTGSYMKGEKAWTVKRFLGTVFGVYSFRSRNIVLPSGANDYIRGKNLAHEQVVEWLYGGNMVLRRSVFESGLRFNPDFKRWAFGEDVMLTYQIHKTFPNSLRFLPDLEIQHTLATSNKILNVEALRMKVIYRYIFWKREVWNRNLIHTLAYVWSQVGLSGLEVLQHPSVGTLRTLLDSYTYLFKNRAAIAQEAIEYNQFIFSNV